MKYEDIPGVISTAFVSSERRVRLEVYLSRYQTKRLEEDIMRKSHLTWKICQK